MTGASPADADAAGAAARPDDAFEQRPEVFVGVALAGGFLLAMLLRKLGPSE